MIERRKQGIESIKFRILKLLALILISFISTQASAQKIKVACVGNSITYGYGLSNPSGESYPGQIQELLGTGEWEVANFGASGRTMLKAGGYSYWDDQLYTNALASNPDIVIIGLGTNDSKRWLWDGKGSEFEADYSAMVQSFQDLATKPDIWIFLLIPGEKQDWDIYNSYIKDKVNPKIKKIALQKGLGLIDLYAVLSERNPEWYLEDKVHPSVTGAGLIAQTVREALLMEKPEIAFANDKVLAPDGYSYQWYINGLPVDSADGGTQKQLAVTRTGKYIVSVQPNESNETRIVSVEMNLIVTGASNSVITNSGVKIYPNPAIDTIYVRLRSPLRDSNYSITDLSGKLLLTGPTSSDEEAIDISSLASGTYVLVIGGARIKLLKH